MPIFWPFHWKFQKILKFKKKRKFKKYRLFKNFSWGNFNRKNRSGDSFDLAHTLSKYEEQFAQQKSRNKISEFLNFGNFLISNSHFGRLAKIIGNSC